MKIQPLRSPSVNNSNSEDQSEAFQQLIAMAGRKSKNIPAGFLADQIIMVTHGADWPVQRAAMEALLRRLSFIGRDNLKLSVAPAKKILGKYQTKVARSSNRPYQTVLRSFDPFSGSCNCPDFLNNSLGICKHLLVVLGEIYKSKQKISRAREEQSALTGASFLCWNPVKPLRGEADLLSGIRWQLNPLESKAVSPLGWQLRKEFLRQKGHSQLQLKSASMFSPEKKIRLIKDIDKLYRQYLQKAGSKADLMRDPALEEVLAKELLRLQDLARLALPASRISAAVKSLKKPLFPYQLQAVEKFFNTARLLLADDMGLGKTAQSIGICHTLWKNDKITRGLLIVPAALKSQWLREWCSFCDTPAATVEGTAKDRASIYARTKKGFLITNYEQVMKDFEIISKWAPQMIVLDEAQRIKNWETKTSAYIKSLLPPYRLVLTGTPLENRIDELASILDWIDAGALEPKWRLAPWHSIYADGHKEIMGARNLDTLRERIGGCTMRRIRQEVLKQLPKRTDTRIDVTMKEEQIAAHDELQPSIAKLISISIKRPLLPKEFLSLMSLLLMQRLISNGLELQNFDAAWPDLSQIKHPTEEFLTTLRSPKLPEFRALIEQLVFQQGQKVIVFSQWRKMIALANWSIAGLLAENSCRAVFFTGQEKEKRRTQNIVDFHDDPQVPVMFLSDAGGVGLNLQKAASCCINLELPWNPAVLEQRIGRIYRLGQKEPVQIFNLVANYGIEERIAGIINNKKALFKGLFDGTSNEIVFENNRSMMAELKRLAIPADAPAIDPQSSAANLSLLADCQENDLEADESGDKSDLIDLPTATHSLEQEIAINEANQFPDKDPGSRRQTLNDPEPTSSRNLQNQPHSLLQEPQDLFSSVKFHQASDGSLTIHAPPETAKTLASLFEGMAQMFRRAVG